VSSLKRTLAVSKKVLRTLKHDRRSLALMLLAPVIAMVVFGFVFGSETKHVPVAVVDEDPGPLPDRILANLPPDLLEVTRVDSWLEAQAAVRDGTYAAAIRFPANLSAAAQAGETATLFTFVDGSNSQEAVAVSRALAQGLQGLAQGSGPSRQPVAIETSYAYAEGARVTDYLVPGIMSFAALTFTTLLTLLAFVGERTSGTLSRLLMTPLREWEVVTGYALAFGIIGILQGAILLGVAVWVFDAMMTGSLLLAFLVVALMALDALSLGILLSAAARQEGQAVQMIPFVIFPTFLLSGIFVPVESLPGWLQPLAWAIPPTHAVAALRDIMLRGWGLEHVGVNLAVLAGFAVVFLGLAAVGLRRQRA